MVSQTSGCDAAEVHSRVFVVHFSALAQGTLLGELGNCGLHAGPVECMAHSFELTFTCWVSKVLVIPSNHIVTQSVRDNHSLLVSNQYASKEDHTLIGPVVGAREARRLDRLGHIVVSLALADDWVIHDEIPLLSGNHLLLSHYTHKNAFSSPL